jgi:hypothetical protein
MVKDEEAKEAASRRFSYDGRRARLAGIGACLALTMGFSVPLGAQTTEQPASAPPVASPWDAPEPWRTDRFYLQTSVYTLHYNPTPEHVNQQKLLNAEWRFNSFAAGGQWLAGMAFFNNSFGQASQYLYGGWLVRPFESAQPLYLKITAGALHGYKGEYQNKIPFNSSGVAPAILPSIGYCYSRVCTELILFGNSGLMVTLGVTVP